MKNTNTSKIIAIVSIMHNIGLLRQNPIENFFKTTLFEKALVDVKQAKSKKQIITILKKLQDIINNK